MPLRYPASYNESLVTNRFLPKTPEQQITPKEVYSVGLQVYHLGSFHDPTLRGRTLKFTPRTEVVSIVVCRTGGAPDASTLLHVAFGIEKPDLQVPNAGIAPSGVQNSFYLQFPAASAQPPLTIPGFPIYIWKFKVDTSKVYIETADPATPFWGNFDIFVYNCEVDLGMQLYSR